MSFEKFYQEYLQEDDPDYTVSLYDRLKWLYDKAHRKGWEQAKMEAVAVVHAMEKVFHPSQIITDRCANAVTAMVYKEEEK